jgi:drug/metabolite transporter (DMT)-like permease
MLYYFLFALALINLSQASNIVRWSQTDPGYLGTWRLLIAAATLFLWQFFKNFYQREKGAVISKAVISKQDYQRTLLASFFFFGYLYAHAYAAHHTSIANCMLLSSTHPLITASIGIFYFKELFKKTLIISYLLCAIGIFILFFSNQQSVLKLALQTPASQQLLSGDVAAFIAAFCFSIYTILSKKIRTKLSVDVFASRLYLFAGICFLVTSLLTNGSVLPGQERAWSGILLLTIFSTLLGQFLFTFCLKHLNIYFMSLSKLIEPAMSALVAYFLFGEKIGVPLLLAFIFIMSGLIILIKNQNARDLESKV